MEQTTRYKRVLIKLSGEALATGITGGILNYDFVRQICLAIKECQSMGVQVALVVGAGNIWRGRQGEKMDRTRADHACDGDKRTCASGRICSARC